MLWIPTTRETEDKQWKQKINSNNNDGQRNDFMVWHLNSDPFVSAVIVFFHFFDACFIIFNVFMMSNPFTSTRKRIFIHGLAFWFVSYGL